jgi:aryl-alcohol dehydrogenase-like predicted oxidoreductase
LWYDAWLLLLAWGKGEAMETAKKRLSRREFIREAAALTSIPLIAASCSDDKRQLPSSIKMQGPAGQPQKRKAVDDMPKRVLGKTGLMVSVVAVGAPPSGTALLPFVQRAVELGVNYFDTASEYSSEPWFKEFVPAYRDKIYVATKMNARLPDAAAKEFENSLKNIGSSYVDVLLLHAIGSGDAVAAEQRGLWKWMNDQKSAGAARFIGFSSMNSASESKAFIELLDPDVALLAMSATGYGDFVTMALPAAQKKNTGILAMKIMSGVVGPTHTAKELLAWVLSKDGVASAIIGHSNGLKDLEDNVANAKAILNGTGIQFDYADIERRARPFAGPHALVWARPGYVDKGMGWVSPERYA